jgi:hypothetical protein
MSFFSDIHCLKIFLISQVVATICLTYVTATGQTTVRKHAAQYLAQSCGSATFLCGSCHILIRFQPFYTVKKAKFDPGPKHVGDGKFLHPRKLSTEQPNLCWWRIFPNDLCGWRNFPSPYSWLFFNSEFYCK